MSRGIIKNILTNTVAFLLIFTIISGVYFLVFREVNFIWWLLVVPFFLMHFFRSRVRNVYSFIALHVLLAVGAVFIIGNVDTRWFVLAFMIIAVIYSLIIRIAGERSLDIGIGVLMLILHVVLFILVGQSGASPDIIRQQLVGTCIVSLGLVIAHIQMDNIDTKLKLTNYIDNRTHRADKILSANNTLIVALLC